jgi:hypothetical protein
MTWIFGTNLLDPAAPLLFGKPLFTTGGRGLGGLALLGLHQSIPDQGLHPAKGCLQVLPLETVVAADDLQLALAVQAVRQLEPDALHIPPSDQFGRTLKVKPKIYLGFHLVNVLASRSTGAGEFQGEQRGRKETLRGNL